ncbi:MAG: hypothetical protein M3O06_01700 [Pseudomonadota bacterium]|nr:hypothetical protein [Pseudomonadota bacterium]
MSVKNAILNVLMCLTVLAFPLQCMIDPSAVNIASACIVLASSLSLLAYIKLSAAAEEQPLSTMALLGFCVTSQLGALLVQTAAWTPLRITLFMPLMTFATLALYLSIAIAMHIFYRFMTAKSGKGNLVRGFLGWSGVYRLPSNTALWMMGLIGLVSFPFSTKEGLAARIASGFHFLTWAPFLLPIFIREVGPSYCNARRNQIALGLYTGVVVLLGLAMNVRILMFIGVATIALLYLLMGMRSDAPLTRKAVMRFLVVAGILVALSHPMSDLATSMVIARGSRGKVTPTEMVKKTLSVWRRPALIREYERERAGVARYTAYDEHYIDNPLLARFVETKFHDNMIYFASDLKTEHAKDQLRKLTRDQLWAALPTPLLNLFHVGVNKDNMMYSMADYLAYLTRGVRLGGRKTGSMYAQGDAIMGPLFPILYSGICLLLFGMMDLLTLRQRDGTANLAPLAMMSTWMFFYRGVTSDAVSNIFIFIVRDFWQIVMIYVVVFGIARMFGGRAPREESNVAAGLQRAT